VAAIGTVGLTSLFNLPFVLFLLGAWGIFVLRRNLILLLVSLELMLLAVNLAFIFSSLFLDDIVGQVFSLFILTVAAGESAIGLAIMVSFYRLQGVISLEALSHLKG